MKNTGKTYRPQGNVGLFDSDEAIDKLNAMGNPLAKLADVIDFEMFREELTRKGLFDKLFDTFYRFPEEKGLIMKEGVIIDGSFWMCHASATHGRRTGKSRKTNRHSK